MTRLTGSLTLTQIEHWHALRHVGRLAHVSVRHLCTVAHCAAAREKAGSDKAERGGVREMEKNQAKRSPPTILLVVAASGIALILICALFIPVHIVGMSRQQWKQEAATIDAVPALNAGIAALPKGASLNPTQVEYTRLLHEVPPPWMLVRESELFELFGAPLRGKMEGEQTTWCWYCTDGVIELRVRRLQGRGPLNGFAVVTVTKDDGWKENGPKKGS